MALLFWGGMLREGRGEEDLFGLGWLGLAWVGFGWMIMVVNVVLWGWRWGEERLEVGGWGLEMMWCGRVWEDMIGYDRIGHCGKIMVFPYSYLRKAIYGYLI